MSMTLAATWNTADVHVPLAIISAVAAVLGVVFWRMHRRAKANVDAPTPRGGGLSLDALRAMRDRGEMTDEEFRITRAAVLRTMGVLPPPEVSPLEDDDTAHADATDAGDESEDSGAANSGDSDDTSGGAFGGDSGASGGASR